MSKTKAPELKTIASSEALKAEAHQATGQANLARDRLFLARQDGVVRHARDVLAAYPAQERDLAAGERAAQREFETAVRGGRWPAQEWVQWRAFWYRRSALRDAAMAAGTALVGRGELPANVPAASFTPRDWDFAGDVQAILTTLAADVGGDVREHIDQQRQQTIGHDILAPTRPGRWEEWQTTRTDGAVLRVEKNSDTGEMLYTVLKEAPATDLEPDSEPGVVTSRQIVPEVRAG